MALFNGFTAFKYISKYQGQQGKSGKQGQLTTMWTQGQGRKHNIHKPFRAVALTFAAQTEFQTIYGSFLP